MWRTLLLLLSLPWTLDTAFRAVLAWAARRGPRNGGLPAGVPGERVLVVVPARGEGSAVAPTLASVVENVREGVEALLLLDGSDPEAASAARRVGVDVLRKEPPGPSKAAALRWLTEHHGERLGTFDAVMILDVGSRLEPGFFREPLLPAPAAAAQAWLAGEGSGVADAISLSERAAQAWEDRGRQALGWSVRLRGTGSVFRPGILVELAPRLRTSIEDTEASLLLAARGERIVLTGPRAVLSDDKPSRVGEAARQRSRWLLGQVQLLVRQPGSLFRLLARRPAEGLAFAAELASRPLSLTGPLRLAAGAALAADGLAGGRTLQAAAGSLVAASLLLDLALLRLATGLPWSRLAVGSARLALSWVGAFLHLPRAAAGWVRTRRDRLR